MSRICAGLRCTPMHAFPSDLLLYVDDARCSMLTLPGFFLLSILASTFCLARLALAPLHQK